MYEDFTVVINYITAEKLTLYKILFYFLDRQIYTRTTFHSTYPVDIISTHSYCPINN